MCCSGELGVDRKFVVAVKTSENESERERGMDGHAVVSWCGEEEEEEEEIGSAVEFSRVNPHPGETQRATTYDDLVSFISMDKQTYLVQPISATPRQ